ncbi:ABC transporter permease [Flavisphingomonas formosensis]|uniref:ABC transporter permease n=1 Tax=Flavisphingomonas formosensis TaxID=861534 RepID=UPI0012F725E3|nr:ABC transporter permease [Sphingomonas formosensis]
MSKPIAPPVPPVRPVRARRPSNRVVSRLKRDKGTMTAMGISALIVMLAIAAPYVTDGQPYSGNALERLKPIGTHGHLLGTDELGRDMWTRLVYGARLSLISGAAPVLIALAIGGSLGVIAGYAGGRVNALIMRTMDIFYAFPAVLLAIAACAVLGPGLLSTIAALSIVFTPSIVRITETATTRIRGMDYIEAARCSGATDFRIILHQVLPNVQAPVLVYASSLAGLSIILAAGLSFLGLGMSPPNPEWGQMLNSLRQSIYVQPWVAALPGLMIFVTSVCFNVISDGLRVAMDVQDG